MAVAVLGCWFGIGNEAVAQRYQLYFGDRPDARVRVWNNYHGTVHLYAVDRWGGWRWGETLVAGQTVVLSSPAGQLWHVTDRHGRLVQQFRAQPGLTTVAVEGGSRGRIELPFVPAPVAPWRQEYKIVFRNKVEDPVEVYRLDEWRAWSWVGRIGHKNELAVPTQPGQSWLVRGSRGQVLKSLTAPARDIVVTLDD